MILRSLALTKRCFGVPGFWHSKVDFLAVITLVFQAITQAALDVALGVEGW